MRNRFLARLALSTAFLLTPTSAMAETPVEDRLEAIAETVITGCVDDLVSYCNAVTPGEGRVIACIYAHEDKLSGRCKATLNDVRLQLDRVQNMIGYVASQCLKDVETHCSDVEPGDGRLIKCLDEAGEAVSKGCLVAIDDLIAD